MRSKKRMRGGQVIGFGNPQPSGPQQDSVCVNNLYFLALVSLPCGMLCFCACVISALKLPDFLSLDLMRDTVYRTYDKDQVVK